jgi:hypothetical protein
MICAIASIRQVAPGMAMVGVSGTRSKIATCLWVSAPTRKRADCIGCGTAILVGDTAYRPTRDTDYRMRRLCEECVEID